MSLVPARSNQSVFHSNHRETRSGFTLIELLVVIAIIAILAAILFPVFAQARAKARQTQCLSNCKQIGLAMMQYIQDYDEVFPVNNFSYGRGTSVYLSSWMIHLDPYMKNLDVYQCPESRVPNSRTTIVTGGRTFRLPDRSLGANEWIVGRVGFTAHNNGAELNPVSQASLSRVADVPLVADSVYLLFNDPRRIAQAGFAGSPWFNYPTSQTEVLSDRHARHNGGSTIVWSDGHASWKHKRATGNILAPRQTLPNWWTWFGLPVDPISDDRLL